MRPVGWDAVEVLVDTMIEQQEAKLRALAARLGPHLTGDDILQPHDHAVLMESAEFNYEDGILAGLKAVAMAVRATRRGGRVDSPPRGGS
jgi:hypothetical protein